MLLQILRKVGTYPQSLQRFCKLLSIPNDILLYIIKQSGLDVFDKACLMLTCKEFANMMVNFEKGLGLKAQLKSGVEDERLEILSEIGWDGYADEEEYLTERLALVRKCKQRVDEAAAIKFYRLLDLGWNRSHSRFCHACNKFRSTSQRYWDKKAQGWLYKFTGRIAQGYRIMRDCRCACTPEKAINKWVELGNNKDKESMWCPECVFGDTTMRRNCCGDFCDACYDDCGCHECQCGGGCRYS